MQSLLITWVVIMVACCAGYFFWSRRHKSKLKDIDMPAEKMNALSYTENYLNKDYSYIKKWMEGNPIDAFTSCSIPTTMGDHAKNFAKDMAKTAAWAMVGVKARYNRVEKTCFMVLSGKDVYFFGLDTNGKMDEKILFDAFALKEATIQYKGFKNQTALTKNMNSQFMPQQYEISFGTKNQSLYVYDQLIEMPDVTQMFSGKYADSMVKAKVIGQLFLEKLGSIYPNLQVELKN